MRSQKDITLRSLANHLFDIYAAIIGAQKVETLRVSSNSTGRRLRFLKKIADGNLDRDQMSTEETIAFYEASLDCSLLAAATGDSGIIFDPPKIGEALLLGGAQSRQAVLAASDSFIADWYFHLLVHAWLSTKVNSKLKDLRHNKQFRGRKVCDFMVPVGDGRVELVECKRLHPSEPICEDPLPKTIEKAKAWIPKAARQLAATAEDLKYEVLCKHAIFDVSAYQQQPREICLKTGPITVVGYGEAAIESLKEAVQSMPITNVDKITFCFRNLVYIDHQPCAIVQRASPLVLNADHPGTFSYDGWTVEGYPVSESKCAELRVSCTARSLGWIKFTFLNLTSPDGCVEWGPEESLIKPR